MYLTRTITLQVDSCHNLDPLEMICIHFHIHNLRTLMYHSVVKVLKNLWPEIFKIKLQSLILQYCVLPTGGASPIPRRICPALTHSACLVAV